MERLQLTFRQASILRAAIQFSQKLVQKFDLVFLHNLESNSIYLFYRDVLDDEKVSLVAQNAIAVLDDEYPKIDAIPTLANYFEAINCIRFFNPKVVKRQKLEQVITDMGLTTISITTEESKENALQLAKFLTERFGVDVGIITNFTDYEVDGLAVPFAERISKSHIYFKNKKNMKIAIGYLESLTASELANRLSYHRHKIHVMGRAVHENQIDDGVAQLSLDDLNESRYQTYGTILDSNLTIWRDLSTVVSHGSWEIHPDVIMALIEDLSRGELEFFEQLLDS